MTERALISTAVILIAAIGSLLIVNRNWAQNNELTVQYHGFQDTRGVTVLSPTVDLNQDFTDRTNLRVNFGVDAISAASDSCARCHRDGIRSRRQEVGLSITQKLQVFKLTVGGAYSQENFYRSTTGLSSVSRDLANGNTTVAGGFSFSVNQPILHPLPDRENQFTNNAYASVTQTLTKTAIAQVGYELGNINGYQNNPFLRTSVSGLMLVGQVPDTRTRQTATARLRQALPQDTYLEVDFRHYQDDWQLRSNAVGLGISHHLTPQVLMNVSYRRYDQTGAYFYQPSYSAPIPQYYTGDFRLEPFGSNDYIGKVAITPSTQWWWLPAGTGVTLQYERYQADNGFQAAIFSAGLRAPLKLR